MSGIILSTNDIASEKQSKISAPMELIFQCVHGTGVEDLE